MVSATPTSSQTIDSVASFLTFDLSSSIAAGRIYEDGSRSA